MDADKVDNILCLSDSKCQPEASYCYGHATTEKLQVRTPQLPFEGNADTLVLLRWDCFCERLVDMFRVSKFKGNLWISRR